MNGPALPIIGIKAGCRTVRAGSGNSNFSICYNAPEAAEYPKPAMLGHLAQLASLGIPQGIVNG